MESRSQAMGSDEKDKKQKQKDPTIVVDKNPDGKSEQPQYSQYGVIVHSWDFDGMLASQTYVDDMKKIITLAAINSRMLKKEDFQQLAKKVIASQKTFFDSKFAQQNQKTPHVMFVGSDRQSRHVDFENGGIKKAADNSVSMTLSCTMFYEALVEELKAQYKINITLDKLWLEDIALQLPPGTCFEQTKKSNMAMSVETVKALAEGCFADNTNNYKAEADEQYKEASHLQGTKEIPATKPNAYSDKHKYLLLRTQMHYAKKKYAPSDERMLFEFIDDRKDKLEGAQKWFKQCEKNVPPKVDLRLEQNLPEDSEYKKNPQLAMNGDSKKMFAEFKSVTLQPGFSAVHDESALKTFQVAHQLLSAPSNEDANNSEFDVLMQKKQEDGSHDAAGEVINEKLDEAFDITKNQLDILSAIKELVFVTLATSSQKGIVGMREVFKNTNERSLMSDTLTQLQQEVQKRLEKKHMVSGDQSPSLFQFARDPVNQKIYKAIQDINCNKPDASKFIETIKNALPENGKVNFNLKRVTLA